MERRARIKGQAAAIALIVATCSALPSIARADQGLDLGERIAELARAAPRARLKLLRRDCSGFVNTVLLQAVGVLPWGKEVLNTAAIWSEGLRRGWAVRDPDARPGDIAVFHKTVGGKGTRLTHIALVIGMDDEGTLDLVHLDRYGIKLFRMNLARPDDARVNSRIAAARAGPEKLAGQLWRGFVRLPGEL